MSLPSAVLRMLCRAGLVAMIVTLLSWTLVECAPGTTAERAAMAARAIAPGDVRTPPETRAQIVQSVGRRHGLDASVARRLAGRISGLTTLDLGRSWRDERPVFDMLFSGRGLVTLTLCFLALCATIIVGLLGAAASARRPRSVSHRLWTGYAALILSVPVPWVAMAAIRSLAYGEPLALFPSGGLASPVHLMLPVLVLASAPTAVIWRHAREEMASVSASSWVLAARARGIPESRLWRVSILRAVLPNALSLVPGLLAYLLAAAILVERVFAIHGLGDLVTRAAASGDAPVLIGMAAVTAATVSMASSLVDHAAASLDPRREGPQ